MYLSDETDKLFWGNSVRDVIQIKIKSNGLKSITASTDHF